MKQMPYKQIEQGLKELSKEEVEPFHFERMMARTRTEIQRRNPIMVTLKRTAITSGVVVALFIAMLLIPASYSVNVGSIVKAEFDMNEASLLSVMDSMDKIEGVTNQNLSVDNGKAVLNLAFRDRSASKAEGEVKSALIAAISDDSHLSVSSEDIKKQMGGNALAAVTGGAIRIGVEDMSDSEIEALIVNAVNASGAQVRNVDVSTTELPDGEIRRMIRIEAECPDGANPDDIDLSPLMEGLEENADGRKIIKIRKNCEDCMK
ncbi:hypothetical protein K9N50_00695 [bacterium]|nr:hypothetical protein [bacterium]